jgi:hypothetical protein
MIISMSSFQLKGGGWFADGYSNSPKSKGDSNKSTKEPSCPKAKSSCASCQTSK